MELGLSSRRSGFPADARPSGRLADPPILARSGDHDRRATGGDPVDRLIGKGIGGRVLGSWNVGGRPAPREFAEDLEGLRPEWPQLGVLDPPSAVELLDDQVRIQEELDAPRPELAGERDRPHDADVLGDIVRPDPEILRDRGIWTGPRIADVRAIEPDEHRAGRGRSRIPAGGAVGPDQVTGAGSGRRLPGPIGRGTGTLAREPEVEDLGLVALGYVRRSTIAELTSRIACVMWMPRGHASVQLKIVRQRQTPSSPARISSRSSAASSRVS